MEVIYKRSTLVIMTKKRKKRKNNSEIIDNEEENGLKPKDILSNNKTSKNYKMFVTM